MQLKKKDLTLLCEFRRRKLNNITRGFFILKFSELLKPFKIMSILFKDVSDDTTIEVSLSLNVIEISLFGSNIQFGGVTVNLDIPTAIALRKALSLNIGKARNPKGGSNE